jgi:hypothetical protein
MPLLIEIGLLAATAYLYWLTRKLIKGSGSQFSIASLAANREEPGDETINMSQIEMMQDIAALLNEWETTASAVREDWLRQQTRLQTTLSQAENTIVELRLLINQTETQKDLPSVSQRQAQKRLSNQDILSTISLPSTMAESILAFSHYLRQNNYSQITVIRTTNRAQHFITWLGEQILAQVPLRQVNSNEIENYNSYLIAQPVQVDFSIERELTAIKVFADWINNLCDCHQLPQAVELNHSLSSITLPGKMSLAQGADRYRNVFTLADQGLDSATITAQTGLEREAVRLMLSMRSSSPIKS